MKKFIALFATALLMFVGVFAVSNTASADVGSSQSNPIITTPEVVPEGAVEDNPSTYLTDAKCDTTRSWVHTVPAVEETFHKEYRYKRGVPEEAAETHQEYKYEKTVQDEKVQYHFAKFTRIKYKSGSNWGEYSAWTKWSPETHTSWQDSKEPLGEPEKHGSGVDSIGKFYRQWQAQWDGRERTIPNGSHKEYKGWTTEILDAPWVKVEEKTVTDKYAVPARTEYYVSDTEISENPDDATWQKSAPESDEWVEFDYKDVGDGNATPAVITYYAWSDGKVCETQPPVTEPPTEESSETPTVTPTPTVDPTPTSEPTITPEPSETPSVTPSQGVGTPVSTTASPKAPVKSVSAPLPNTGGPNVLLIAIGVLVIAVGGMTVVAGRKTRH